MTLINNCMRRGRYLMSEVLVGIKPVPVQRRTFRKGLIQTSPFILSKKSLWRVFYSLLNLIDESRIESVGPDRSCAEWLLKCGASVKWEGFDKPLTDYLHLPPEHFDLSVFKIEEIECVDSYIMAKGFPHFEGCQHIKKIILHECPFLNDDCLQIMAVLKDSLQHLQLTSCGKITDEGIRHLRNLESLKTLLLFDLKSVKKKDYHMDYLQQHLPNCSIDWPEKLPQDRIPKKISEER